MRRWIVSFKMYKKQLSEKFIDMAELCQIIKATDPRTAEKWCKEKGLTTLMLGKKKMIYRFMVELELDKVLIEKLKKQHPEHWEELYRCYLEDNHYEYLALLENRQTKSNRIVKAARSKAARDFLNQLNE